MHFLYLFILQFMYNSACFERQLRSSSGVHDLLYLQLCTNHANVPNCSVLPFQPYFSSDIIKSKEDEVNRTIIAGLFPKRPSHFA